MCYVRNRSSLQDEVNIIEKQGNYAALDILWGKGEAEATYDRTDVETHYVLAFRIFTESGQLEKFGNSFCLSFLRQRPATEITGQSRCARDTIPYFFGCGLNEMFTFVLVQRWQCWVPLYGFAWEICSGLFLLKHLVKVRKPEEVTSYLALQAQIGSIIKKSLVDAWLWLDPQGSEFTTGRTRPSSRKYLFTEYYCAQLWVRFKRGGDVTSVCCREVVC